LGVFLTYRGNFSVGKLEGNPKKGKNRDSLKIPKFGRTLKECVKEIKALITL